ncbi:hypothetical protein LZ012_07530 [Dechloromonas sp. XY25]|uniref:Cell wall hydrolase SleB domain-containing protein n=1 Tax=Dechloromonas hankyongensis TaxID=2908002 RepID=A0ABS9K100_9RHOO|nr:hypothetical protein [Dechloromonas hankyongensis]MCG2576842.1 hypothetical protein [Dechloromonas hankyongensis]
MTIDAQTRKLAAIAYGEASGANDANEIGGIAWAVANRARAWGEKTVGQLLAADPNYTYAVKDGNPRYKKLMAASEKEVAADKGMTLALDCASNALANTGTDPSNGAYWWDGLDFKTNYQNHPKVKDGFHIIEPAHNIFDVKETSYLTTIYWKVRDKKTGKEVNSKVRGTYKYVWESTAAYGKTIFWKHDADYLKATAGKAYK